VTGDVLAVAGGEAGIRARPSSVAGRGAGPIGEGLFNGRAQAGISVDLPSGLQALALAISSEAWTAVQASEAGPGENLGRSPRPGTVRHPTA
jgi:hypothetical protein